VREDGGEKSLERSSECVLEAEEVQMHVQVSVIGAGG
jgi:hypothetical protein